MDTPTKTQQRELFKAGTTWIHIFRDMVYSGEMAKLGPYAWGVYCVIKAYTDFQTGNSLPSIELIAEKSQISISQVKRALKTLEDEGYLLREKKGRSSHYTLREKLEIRDAEGIPQAIATWDYAPTGVQAAIADLKNVLITGDFAGAKIVQINTLHVQVNNNVGNHNINIQITEEQMNKLPADTRKALESIKNNMQKK